MINANKIAYDNANKAGAHSNTVTLMGLVQANESTAKTDPVSSQNMVAAAATLAVRQKISIDLHDSAIQPYIGLKLGLEALRRKIPQDEAIAADVEALLDMTADSIAELRQYIAGLKSQIKSQTAPPLVPSILEMTNKFQHRHGIEVIVNVDPALNVSEYLATEVYQLVCEGLSNVLRHTAAKQAVISIISLEDRLIVEVLNHDDCKQGFIQFKPRSMTERVAYLGGTVSVTHAEGKTVVTAEIPLQLKDRRYAALA